MVKTKQTEMTSKAALCMALLEGRVLNVKNVFKDIGLTNCSREISRMIEKPFGVVVSRTPKVGVNRYGTEVTWIDYRLNRSEMNLPGIAKMMEYLEPFIPNNPKTQTEQSISKQFQQLSLL
jgi:hypothetical protein